MMFRPDPGARVFLMTGATDLRKQINGLTMIAEQRIGEDPFTGALFCFCNSNRKLVKVVYWDRSGFCLWQKRLSAERFPWPKNQAEALQLNGRDLIWILEGMALPIPGGHHERCYKTVC